MASFDFASLTPVLSLSKGSGRTVAQTFIPLVLSPLPLVLSPLPLVLSPLPFVLSVAKR